MFREMFKTFLNNCNVVFPGSTASSVFGLCLYAAKYSEIAFKFRFHIQFMSVFTLYNLLCVCVLLHLGYVTLKMPCVQNLNTNLDGYGHA